MKALFIRLFCLLLAFPMPTPLPVINSNRRDWRKPVNASYQNQPFRPKQHQMRCTWKICQPLR